MLYVPAANPRALEKARTLGADAVIIDLEDSVAPEAKPGARAAAVEALATPWPCPVIVRCNGLDTPWGAADLAALAGAAPDGVLAPKVRGLDDLAALEAALQGAPGRTRLWVMIETARAVLGLAGIAAAGGRLEGFVVGLNDLALETRMRIDPTRSQALPVLTQLVLAARAHGLAALDGVYNRIDDPAGFEAECLQGASLGFDGKTVIHPSQIAPCNRAFGPTEAEIAWAREIVAAYAAPDAAAKGAIQLKGQLVERLHLVEAERTLKLAET